MPIPNTWYAAAWSRELGHVPLGRKLFGEQIVLLRDDNGLPHALNARCPHRGADLSKGHLVDGSLECPFHGWRFHPTGYCVRIPSQPTAAKIPRTATLKSLKVCEHEDVVWVHTGQPNTTPPSRELSEDGRRVAVPGRLLNGSLMEVLENSTDTAHNAFIHKRVFGSRLDPIVARQLVVVDDVKQTVTANADPNSPWTPSGPMVTGFMGIVARLLGQSSPAYRHTEFKFGGRIKLYIEYPSGKWDAFFFYLSPADKTHTWMFYETVRTRATLRLFDFVQRSFMNRILDDGAKELSLIVRIESDDRQNVSVESDRLSLAVTRYYNKCTSGCDDGV